jgi:hypothetical protein
VFSTAEVMDRGAATKGATSVGTKNAEAVPGHHFVSVASQARYCCLLVGRGPAKGAPDAMAPSMRDQQRTLASLREELPATEQLETSFNERRPITLTETSVIVFTESVANIKTC